jgi:hypothetical protein
MQRHWFPDTVDWQDTGDDGTRYALLSGNRTTPGLVFTYAFLIPPGFWDPPHWHTQTAHVFVAKGTLQLGYGSVHDRAALIAFPAGAFVEVPADARHFDGAEEETIIFGVACGPWATHYVQPGRVPSAGTPVSAP